MRRLLLCSVPLSLMLSGCSAMLGLGEDEFSCSGMPQGVKCLSALEVYQSTDYKDYVSEDDIRYFGKQQDGSKKKARGRDKYVNSRENTGAEKIAQRSQPMVREATPAPDRAIPIRTPARVIRVWIAPWEDKAGYLNMSSYTYAELQGRRWAVGEPYRARGERGLRLLQNTPRKADERSGTFGVGRNGSGGKSAGTRSPTAR